jgi:hypothetical protein
MTITVPITTLANLNNPTTATTTINSNFTALQTGFNSALNTTGDQMLGTLDMNNQQIINLPAPSTVNSPARLVDVVAGSGSGITVPTVGTSGTVVGYLNSNMTFSGANTFTGTNTFSSAVTFNTTPTYSSGFTTSSITATTANLGIISGVTSITGTNFNASAISASSLTVTSLNLTSITVSSQVTAPTGAFTTLTANIVTAPTAAITSIAASSATFTDTVGLSGTTNISGATAYPAAGIVGELISASSAASVALAANAASAFTAVTLTAGAWMLGGQATIQAASSLSLLETCLSQTAATFTGALSRQAIQGGVTAFTLSAQPVGPVPLLATAGTTVYLNVLASSAATCLSGQIYAWRLH